MPDKTDISSITVIGAGTMGHGIAQVAAVGGFNVVLNDVAKDLLETAVQRIQSDLLKATEIGKLRAEQMNAALKRVQLETKIERAVEHADLVIEAVPERIDLKLDLFARLEQVCSPKTMFASN